MTNPKTRLVIYDEENPRTVELRLVFDDPYIELRAYMGGDDYSCLLSINTDNNEVFRDRHVDNRVGLELDPEGRIALNGEGDL